ncbi:hypothetical protein PMAYCL1PPCAC_23930, partial [Pristionchus mayeri]
MPHQSSSNKLMKFHGKVIFIIYKKLQQLVPRDTIFVPSNIGGSVQTSDQTIPCVLNNYTEMTLGPAAELSPLPKYEEVVSASDEYRISHLKSQ